MEALTLPRKAFFRPAEVAEYLSVSVRTIQRWCKSGKLLAVRLPSGDYRLPRSAIVKLLDEAKE
jgi:excisionase family DNA binding protein